MKLGYQTNTWGGDFRPLGEGEVDVAGIWAALDAIGYSGWVTAELDT